MYTSYPLNSKFSPARIISSPHLIRSSSDVESCSQYFTELLAERQNLGPFMQVLPLCSILLDQEILRAYGRIPSHGFDDYNILQHGSPSQVSPLDVVPDLGVAALNSWNCNGWNDIQHERIGPPQGMHVDWQSAPGSSNSFTVKRIMRLDIPVERYPNFNFVGRLLGPRGNSLKRIEASTGCRVFIRGKGSIKDPDKEESLRGKPGYKHLSEPLHIMIETDLPANIVDVKLKQAKDIIEELLKPVDESHDTYKRQQLRELAILNNIREERPQPQPRGSVSPFSSASFKRSKFGW